MNIYICNFTALHLYGKRSSSDTNPIDIAFQCRIVLHNLSHFLAVKRANKKFRLAYKTNLTEQTFWHMAGLTDGHLCELTTNVRHPFVVNFRSNTSWMSAALSKRWATYKLLLKWISLTNRIRVANPIFTLIIVANYLYICAQHLSWSIVPAPGPHCLL